MLRFLLVPRSVLGFGVRVGLLFTALIWLGRVISLALTQVVETGHLLALLYHLQGAYLLAILRAMSAASPLGTP